MNRDELPDLAGKHLRITIRGSEDTGAQLTVTGFELQGGRIFIVGTVPKGGSTADWIVGVRACIAWDDVTDYLVFDSPEHYAECERKYDKAKKKRK